MFGVGLRSILCPSSVLLAVSILASGGGIAFAEGPGSAGKLPASPVAPCQMAELGTPYIPLDSWMYTSLTRLYSLGYLDLAYLGLRPWTRSSVIHIDRKSVV